MSKTWRIQRPATVWIETTVNAQTLDEALEIADEDFNAGNYEEDLNQWSINFDRYWIEDEDGEQYTDEERKEN